MTKSPFFLMVAPNAPHVPSDALSTDLAAIPTTVKAPRGPAFNEADISDKPSMVKARGLMSASSINNLDASYRRETATLRAVDRMFLHIYQKIDSLGALNDTYIFASDNGWMRGDHRIPAGKGWSYWQVMQNPLVMWGPSIAAGKRIDALVQRHLAPTIAESPGLPRAARWTAAASPDC